MHAPLLCVSSASNMQHAFIVVCVLQGSGLQRPWNALDLFGAVCKPSGNFVTYRVSLTPVSFDNDHGSLTR